LKALTHVSSDNYKMLVSKIILARFFTIVDSRTSLTLCYGVGIANSGTVGVGKFWELGVEHFTFDSATLGQKNQKACCLPKESKSLLFTSIFL